MTKKILATPQGKVIKLADGNDYTLSPLNLNTLANLEEEFNCDISELEKKLSEGRQATVFRRLLWIFLRECYPSLTLEDIGKLVSLNQMAEVVKELTAGLEGLNIAG